jgi:alpha-tubulin suppressor-like RCC1 family protein
MSRLHRRRAAAGLRIAALLIGCAAIIACNAVLGFDGLRPGECEEGAKDCRGNTPQVCEAGQWQDVPDGACVDHTCQNGVCTGECAKGSRRCGGETPQECSEQGQWEVSGPPCKGEQRCNGGVCILSCKPDDVRCASDVPQVCDKGGAWQTVRSPCPRCSHCNQDTLECDVVPEATCMDPVAVATIGARCALLPGGRAKCWGENQWGQLGLGDTENRGDGADEVGAALPLVDLGPGEEVIALASGVFHTCALLSGGRVKCWGWNYSGQLGLGDTENRGDGADEMGAALPLVDLGPGETATAIAAGYEHTCALLESGSVKCWGSNGNGQLGLGDIVNRGNGPGQMGAKLPPIDLGPGKTATAIAAGGVHTCALLSGGSVKCWGWNLYGQLGLGDIANRGDVPGQMGAKLPPVDLGPGEMVTAIAAGGFHTCALLQGGEVKCWGWNLYGQLGLGDQANHGDVPGQMGDNLPVIDLGPGETVSAIAAGQAHSCALLQNGRVKCWGRNDNGLLGIGDTDARGDDPGEMGAQLPVIDLGPGETPTAITASHVHNCALLAAGSIKCWGANEHGELGLGDRKSRGDDPNEMGAELPPVDL